MAKIRSVYHREILYPDGSGAELSVRLDTERKLCGDKLTDAERDAKPAYVEIGGVGDDVSVRADYIPQLVEMLQEAAADEIAARARALGATVEIENWDGDPDVTVRLPRSIPTPRRCWTRQ